MTTITIATRKSMLAMWQTEAVARQLEAGGATTRIVAMETRGDKILDRSIVKIGSKGVFTEELEQQLASGTTDIAVHSAKDMQSVLPEGFELIAFTGREQSHDVLVSYQDGIDLNDRARRVVIGTSSVRRIALLRHYYPHVIIAPMRGNLQTRLKKLRDGACDALMLAYAGVTRMKHDELIVHHFPVDRFVPPVGQGCIAIEASVRLAIEKKELIRRLVNDHDSELVMRAERAYLKRLEGGCSIPAFGHCRLENETLILSAGLASLDGGWLLNETMTGAVTDPEALGGRLADYVLENGGHAVLTAIREAQRRGEDG